MGECGSLVSKKGRARSGPGDPTQFNTRIIGSKDKNSGSPMLE